MQKVKAYCMALTNEQRQIDPAAIERESSAEAKA